MEGFSVIMPTYNQSTFIRRAIKSLFEQTFKYWELIIINDGATDETESYIKEYLNYDNIIYIKNANNKGLGYAINQGLEIANYDYIAYLPSDDFYYNNHLEVLYEELGKSKDIVLVYSKANSEIRDSLINDSKEQFNGLFYNYGLQLVQTAHRKTEERWITRDRWISNNLFDLFWYKLTDKGSFMYIDQETSCWSVHMYQHHNILDGGLNKFRQYYDVKEPLKIKISKSRLIDEVELYKDYRKTYNTVPDNEDKQLKILLVGELAYHPERMYALEEHGCSLYGLWMRNPTFNFTTVGQLPFGNVTEVPYKRWREEVRKIKPDIIYACLNFGAIPLAYKVLKECKDVPFVWHFKEGPFMCRQNGTWEQLIELYEKADGRIYINKESKAWYEQFISQRGLSFILDGDLPKINYFTNDFSSRLSDSDGEIHTVSPGRLIGIGIDDIKKLKDNKIHTHVYIEEYFKTRDVFIKEAFKVAPNHFHIHPPCQASNWVKEFSKYDAGWLHSFNSENYGHLIRAGWNDLNMPARMSLLAAAGLPMIQRDNTGHIVAMQSCVKDNNMGFFYNDIKDLTTHLYNKNYMDELKSNVIKNRFSFSFDKHVPQLIDFFKKVIVQKTIN